MDGSKLSLDTTEPHDFEPPPIDWENSSLDQIMKQYGSDKSTLDHGYCSIYEKYFWPMRSDPIHLLEIGVACGASLKGWSRFFENGSIYGVDIRPECANLCQGYDRISIEIGDATKSRFSNESGYSIIIDDGSHVARDIADTFGHHWPLLRPGGFYCIEDTGCLYSGYRTHLQTEEWRYSSQHYKTMIAIAMQKCDKGEGVEFLHHWEQLTIIKKRGR